VGAARLVALMLFLVGIAINLVLGCLAAPDILQVMSSAVRNLGLMVMGHPILLTPDPGRPRIDFGAIAAHAGVWAGITAPPEAEHTRPAGRLMATLVFGKNKQPCTLANHTNFRSFSNGHEGISTS
jgi:hypothetical protein